MVTTPDSMPKCVAVHSQLSASDLNAWVNLFRENLESFGSEKDTLIHCTVLYITKP